MPPEERTDRRRLQRGIYFGREERPGRCYRLLLIDVEPGATRRQVADALAEVWELMRELREGVVRELQTPGHPPLTVPAGDLTCLLGFGAPLFARYPELPAPAAVRPLNPDQPFRQIWPVDADRRPGEAAFALQLIAETELAVDRAIVETSMLIAERSLPLRVVTFHDGFNRDDRRSWLGFGDGISNIRPDDRLTVIETAGGNPDWMRGGTYMAFLRMAVDLEAWRAQSRLEQEMRVGRDKVTGCPLVTMEGPVPQALAGCPAGAAGPRSTGFVSAPVPQPFSDLRLSHIHRVHQERGEGPPGAHRIFRQGYEFIEMSGGRLRVGLNFVSFQGDLERLTFILNREPWLGGSNFGGVPERPLRLAALIGGGFYAVPPGDDPFPGAPLF